MKNIGKSISEFGFLCSSAERSAKNRHKIQIGINKIESWVGREIEKNIPRFYWLTLISDVLLARHDVPLCSVISIVKEYSDLGNGMNFLKFYESPENWDKTSDVKKLCTSFPSIFNIDDVEVIAYQAKGVMELLALLRGL